MIKGKLCEFISSEEIRSVIEDKFREVKSELSKLMPYSDIYHVGSSAVAGALTKRDLDIAVLVDNKRDFDSAVAVLRGKFEPLHEHRFWVEGEKVIFTKQLSGEVEMMDIVLVLKGSKLDRYVTYRNLLRNNPKLLKVYNKMKDRYQGKSCDEYEERKFKFWDEIYDSLNRYELENKSNFEMDLGITLEQANELVDKYITDPVTKLHSQESQLIMQAIARHLQLSDELVEKYGIIGLLHDLDWDMTKDNPAEHSIKTAEILREVGASDFLVETIQSHDYGYQPSEELRDKTRTTRLQHSLASAETLTGLIVASSLILPTKTVKDLKLKSLKKKFKTKKFAERCDRNIILECEKIGLTIDKFLEIGLMRAVNNE